ncbi:tRNA preQ1(34) S-adenosylmethionine ribosyltransferase-isomerase QueA [Prosthecochloris sp. GSB1]|uniref:tRNA preQ1(34) S-adenosylmethionine ribosyltransferase-isomerase QueA n=1 Tax=Prosthecochloris sp. GSB1 TaxID=281093 RepID=UPI000B8C8A32|nr:tRNA preQ1(34) S-adenosylmethionine ribosyltransferase-isomerase QueA [Prosthecochloris sp. GSB1]ASQ90002.1 tRNA preQ1(34) S-adenosylmethionine ribosyltransferase-isomerase QueA [Prosthecochloris sp. GSB1]
MKTSDYDYILPETAIALYPPLTRGTTKLEVLDRASGSIRHSRYADLAMFLKPGDLLLLNNSRVVQARLLARKTTGANIELVLLEKHRGEPQNRVMYRGRLKPDDMLVAYGKELIVEALEGEGIARIVCRDGGELADFFAENGQVPIPPYLRRAAEEVDRERYQTVFAETPGSVAAPTASLNMTGELIDCLRRRKVDLGFLTLHVGLGTFMPVRGEDLDAHVMHREYYHIPAETIEKIRGVREAGGRVVAVGTTVTRALEHASDLLVNVARGESVEGEADIFIYPGYRFRVVDGLVTNYHAPRSTVLMLTAAFAGWANLKKAYGEALKKGYRFLSYGDSMLIL